MSLKRKFYLAHRIRKLVEATCRDVPPEMFHKILQLIDTHLEEERLQEENEKTKDHEDIRISSKR